MCLQPPQRSFNVRLHKPLPLCPCCPNTLHTAEPGCNAITAEIKHGLQLQETVLSKEKYLENIVVF